MTRQAQLATIYNKIKECNDILVAERNNKKSIIIVEPGLNSELPGCIKFNLAHRLPIHYNAELDYLMSLYNAIRETAGDDAVKIEDIKIDNNVVDTLFLDKPTQLNIVGFLLENHLADTAIQKFYELKQFINKMDDADPRKPHALKYFNQLGITYNLDWIYGDNRKYISDSVDVVQRYLALSPQQAADLENPTVIAFMGAASEMHKTGIFRLLASTMLAMLTAILIAGFAACLFTPIFLVASSAVVVICTLVSAILGFGAFTSAFSLGMFATFSTGNRTRELGNRMMDMQQGCIHALKMQKGTDTPLA